MSTESSNASKDHTNHVRISEFLELIEEHKKLYDADDGRVDGPNFRRRKEIEAEMTTKLPAIEQIMSEIDPLRDVSKLQKIQGIGINGWHSWEFDSRRESLLRMKGIMEDRLSGNEEFANTNFSVPTGQLHEWVWDAAKSHWEDKYYRDAVEHAYKAIVRKIQNKINNKSTDGVQLFQEAFSVNDGRQRLRFQQLKNDVATHRSMLLGAMKLGEAAAQGIRNPLSHIPHDESPMEQQECLECLNALSLLARWIDRAEIGEYAVG